MKKICERTNEKDMTFEIFEFGENDFDLIKNFYSNEISILENKEFFYPYKDEEIKSILKPGGGIFIGAYFEKQLVGLSAVDYDYSYSEKLKRIILDFYPIENCDVFEYSGVMVKDGYRGLKIAKILYSVLSGLVKKDSCYLCAVIQITNFKSLNNFFSLGFKMVAIFKMNEEFCFGYLVKSFNAPPILSKGNGIVNACSFDKQAELLKNGFVGVGIYLDGEKKYIKFN